MGANFIKWALRNSIVVLMIAVAVDGCGFYSVNNTKVDNYTLPFWKPGDHIYRVDGQKSADPASPGNLAVGEQLAEHS